jgi:uncharacterized protein YkwD
MVSVLVGVAVAVGGDLLWLRPSGAELVAAESDHAEPGVYTSPPRHGGATGSGQQQEQAPQAPSNDDPERTTAPATPTTSSRPPAPSRTPGRGTETPPPSTSEKPTPTSQAQVSRPDVAPTPLTREVVRLVNQQRAGAGCTPVRIDSRLAAAAQEHSDDMADRNYLSHTTPDGESFDERIEDAGYSKPAAENIAMGLSTAEAVMNAWMGSEGHRANILNCEITTIGVGVNSSGWYWTQTFGY